LVEESILIKDNLYFGGNYSQLQEIILEDKENEKNVRFFLGYSGWGASQLIEELKENAWIVVDNISMEEIMNTEISEFWKYCLEKQGEKYKIISQFPLNPNEN
jgi:putative transcriptional regulator